MVNKPNDGVFTKSDEEAFDLFAVYCGLALHHAKLYDKIRRSEQKYKVAIEVLSYHSQASEDDSSYEGVPTITRKSARSVGLQLQPVVIRQRRETMGHHCDVPRFIRIAEA